MKEYKMGFKCSNCGAKLIAVVEDGMYGKKTVQRCSSCNEITSVMVPLEQVFIDNQNKKKSRNKSSESPKTEINSNFETEAFLRLEIVKSQNPVSITYFDIDQKQMTIGRKNNSGASAKPDIEIENNDQYMSKKHVVIIHKENKSFVIRDLDSTNGTWINGEKLKPNDEIYIEDDDEIRVGKTYFKTSIVTNNNSKINSKSRSKNETWIE